MEFELTQEILDQIIFAMEDQTEQSGVDPATGQVVRLGAMPAEHDARRYLPLPEWRPVDGYQLMERFVAGLRSPVLRDELREALGAGRGVFRSFKDALRRYPEMEKRWRLFKERAMRAVVYEWYNQMRELQGLERLSLEPPGEAEAAELIEADFVFSADAPAGSPSRREALLEADRAAFLEAHAALDPERAAGLYRRRAERHPALDSRESLVVAAEDHAGQLVGFAWGASHDTSYSGGVSWKIIQLVVLPAYRGIGLGGALLRRLLRGAAERGAEEVLVELEGSSLTAAELFAGAGFVIRSELLGLELRSWLEHEAESGD